MLQEALHALAEEHLSLEKSVGHRSPTSMHESEDDEFYDCDDEKNGKIAKNIIKLVTNLKSALCIWVTSLLTAVTTSQPCLLSAVV